MDRDRREQERPLIKVRAALGKPFCEHCPELHGANSDWLFLQFGNPSRKHLSKRNSRTDSYTVISGVFYIGLGEQFNPEKLEAYPPGSVIVLPGNTSHFHWAKSSEYITQVTAIGPLGLEYVSAIDDPRNHNSEEDRLCVSQPPRIS